MAKLLSGVLPLFGWILPTERGGTPQTIDIEGPIQPVADVSRVAERGFPLYGSFAVSHAGATTERESVSVRSLLEDASPRIEANGKDVWLTNVSCLVDTATGSAWTQAILGYKSSSRPPIAESTHRARAIAYWDWDMGPELVAGEGEVCANTNAAALDGNARGLPILMRPEDSAAGLYMLSQSSGVVASVRIVYDLWVTPRGGTPPGMA